MKYITKACLTCGKSFAAPSKEVNRGHGKFCDLSCGAIYNNAHRSKQATGSSKLKKNANSRARYIWIKRHGKEPLCIHCQKPADIHHDNGNPFDNRDKNLVPLCRSHHASLENARRKLRKVA